jgi:SAM-dependent methyltransferase
MDNPPSCTERPAGWSDFADRHARLDAPLLPTVGDVAAMRAAIAGHDAKVLLLGVTPALAILGKTLTAIDGSMRMVSKIWPGNDARRRTLCGNWLDLPIARGSVDSVIGDGSLNAVASEVPALLREIRRVLPPGGIAALRTFCAPERPESLDAIRHDAEHRSVGNFHALKWRIAMSLAADAAEWTVAVADIRHAFDRMFPDRDLLRDRMACSAADIETIDYYDGLDYGIGFPPVSRLRELAAPVFQSFRVIPASFYPLAERCPTIVLSDAA